MNSFTEWLRLDEALAGNLDKENRILRYFTNYRKNQYGFPSLGDVDIQRIPDILNEKLPIRSPLKVTPRDVRGAYKNIYGHRIMSIVAQMANNLKTPQEIISDLGIPFSVDVVKRMIRDLIKSDEVDDIYNDLLKVRQRERRKETSAIARAAPRLGIEGKIQSLVPGEFVIVTKRNDIGKAFAVAQPLGIIGTSHMGKYMIFHKDEIGLLKAQEAIKKKQIAI